MKIITCENHHYIACFEGDGDIHPTMTVDRFKFIIPQLEHRFKPGERIESVRCPHCDEAVFIHKGLGFFDVHSPEVRRE